MIRYAGSEKLTKAFITDLRADSVGTIAFSIRYFIILSRTYLWTPFNKVRFFINRIRLGSGTRFIGNCIISRYPQSDISIGSNCTFVSSKNVNLIGINRRCIISTQDRNAIIRIGSNCGFSGSTISAFNKIVIGNNVKIGANVLITDSDWHPEDPRSRLPSPIIIQDNVWLGINVVVLKGVTIGENCVIGANSIVTRDVPSNCIAAGNPCRVIREIKKFSE